jgi:hypothetical protein
MALILRVTDTTSHCNQCRQIYPNSALRLGYCPTCSEMRRERIRRELEMSDQRQAAQFSRELITRIKKAGSDQQVLDQVFAKFTELVGGPVGLAEKFKSDFDKVRGENLTQKEAALFERKDSVIVKYWQLAFAIQEKLDDRKNVDASGLTDDDLKATLAQLAAQMMREDPDFRMQVMSSVAMQSIPIDVEPLSGPLPPSLPPLPEEPTSWEHDPDDESESDE